MQLYLIRHGLAVDVGEEGVVTDEDRFLSVEGRRKTTEVATALREIGCVVDELLSSPLKRALQTAEILAEELRIPRSVQLADPLRPGVAPAAQLDWLKSQSLVGPIMLVGHMPDLADLASYLLTGHTDANLCLKKAGVACLSFEDGLAPEAACLEWLMQPKQLRRVAR